MTPAPARLAAGVVIYRVRNGEPEYLLLRNAIHKTWGFAKGHLEGAESFEDGARREVTEETGIKDLEFDPGFRAEIEYSVPAGDGYVDKRVVYFLAMDPLGVVRRSNEHDRDCWEPREKVLSLLVHKNLRDVFSQADARMRAHRHS